MSPQTLIVIGQLARRSGLASSALRYYERVGLLSPAGRTGGRRQYRVSSVERVALIPALPGCGVHASRDPGAASDWRRGRPWMRLVEAKLRELNTRIAQAEQARALVRHALACPHPNLFRCGKFRAALQAHLGAPGRRTVPRRSAD
jgi:DNA-binding transcriptional MerR regulator